MITFARSHRERSQIYQDRLQNRLAAQLTNVFDVTCFSAEKWKIGPDWK